jgi:hypothetical protein
MPDLGPTVVVILLLVGLACTSSEQEPDQGVRQITNEESPTVEEIESDLTELPNAPTYKTVTDSTGVLSVEVPSGWELITGEDSEARSSWSSFVEENVDSSITASTDLDAWHNTFGVPGVSIVVSRELAQRYSDDELVVLGPNDFSASCERGSRRDFDRHPYSGRMQEWKGCGGKGEGGFITLAAGPERRECVVVVQIGMYGEAAQHILDTFQADCGLVSSSSPESNPETAPEAGPARAATGVLERQGITFYMYGTHTISDVSLGIRYALRSEDEELLDAYVGQRVTVHGTLVPGYENGQVEGGPPLLKVTRVEPA